MSTTFTLTPIGRVTSPRADLTDDHWGAVDAIISLERALFTADAVAGLGAFSHLEVVYLFDQVDPAGQQCLAGNGHVLEVDFRSAEAIDGGIVAAGDARALRVDQEQFHTRALALAAAGAGGDEQVGGPGRGIDRGLVTIEDIARTIGLGRSGEVREVVAPGRFGIGEGDDRIAADDRRDGGVSQSAACGYLRCVGALHNE